MIFLNMKNEKQKNINEVNEAFKFARKSKYPSYKITTRDIYAKKKIN